MDFSTLSVFAMAGFILAASPVRAESLVPFADNIEANEVQVLEVTSDALSGQADIRLSLDQDMNLVGLKQYASSGQADEFNLNQLESGAVLFHSSGHDVIKLVTSDLNVHSGGVVNMVYLTNGITESYDHFKMELVNTGSRWQLQVNDRSGHHVITKMFLKGKKILGRFVGIESVRVQ